MDAHQKRRFIALQDPWCEKWLILDLYGIDPQDERFAKKFRRWGAQFDLVVEQPGEMFNRHALERFLQYKKLLPVKWAAARMGMTEESFKKVMKRIVEDELLEFEWDERNTTIPGSVVEDFYKFFPDLRGIVFSDHNTYSRVLHRAILDAYKIEVSPLECHVSIQLTPKSPDLAYEYDCITLEPVGLRYEVWLNFGKPLSLRPDCCSLLFYAQEQPLLKKWVFGSRPHLPPAIRLAATSSIPTRERAGHP